MTGLLILCVVILLLLAGALMLWQHGQQKTRQAAAQAMVEEQLGQRISRQAMHGNSGGASSARKSPSHVWVGPPGWRSLLLCAGVVPTPAFWLRYLMIVGVLVVLAALTLGWLAACVVLLASMVGVYFWFWLKAERRRRRMIQQLPEFLDNVVRMMTIGNSMVAAFQAASSKTNQPLQEVMGRVSSLNRSGKELDVSLRQVSRQFRLHELYLVASVVGIALRFGGRSDQVLQRMAAFMRDLSQARQELAALSSEIKLSAWVLALLPIGIAAFILTFNTDLFMNMWEDPVGWKMLVGALVLQIVGSYWLYRLTKQI